MESNAHKDYSSGLPMTQRTVVHTPMHDTRKWLNPTILFHVCHRNVLRAVDQQGVVWYAGELEGSGNVVFHDSRCLGKENSISAKRCFLAHGTHDLATR